MSDWQPIETAPKDGNWILLFSKEEKIDIISIDAWTPEIRTGCYVYSKWWYCVDYTVGQNPTHWMPLPKPPIL